MLYLHIACLPNFLVVEDTMDSANTRAQPSAIPKLGVEEHKCEDKENSYPKTTVLHSKGRAPQPRVLKRGLEDQESTSRQNVLFKSRIIKRQRKNQNYSDSRDSSDDDKENDEYDAADDEVDVRVDETQNLRNDINNWWRGLPTNWAQLNPLALMKLINVCEAVKRTTQPGSSSPKSPRRGRPRRADKERKFYCPHCIWLRNQTSKSGHKGRHGNARHGCKWCAIWTKEGNDTEYKLSAEEQVICRAEDKLFVLRTLVCELGKASFKARERAEKKAERARKAREAEEVEKAEKARQEAVESESEEG